MMVYDWIDFTKGSNLNVIKQKYLTTHLGYTYKQDSSGNYGEINLYPLTMSKIDMEFCIEFEYKVISFNYADWSHLFSFGTHNNYGGDDPQYAIAFTTPRPSTSYRSLVLYNNGLTPEYCTNWHKWYIYNDIVNKCLSVYTDSQFVGSIQGNPTSASMYFNGSGCGYTFIGAFKYIRITDKITIMDVLKLYNSGNCTYGILKGDNDDI